jgi:hypothetical protein
MSSTIPTLSLQILYNSDSAEESGVDGPYDFLMTLTAKMALTAKMRDCSTGLLTFHGVDYTYCQNGGQRVLIKNHGHNFG